MAGIGIGFHPNISPVNYLCQLLRRLQNVSSTLEHKERKKGIRDTPLTHSWVEQGFGSQGCVYPGVAGEDGKVGIRCDTSSFTCSFR